MVPCTGLYADIQYTEADLDISADSSQEGGQLLSDIFDKYKEHKNLFAKSLLFDPNSENFSKFLIYIDIFCVRFFNQLRPPSGPDLF